MLIRLPLQQTDSYLFLKVRFNMNFQSALKFFTTYIYQKLMYCSSLFINVSATFATHSAWSTLKQKCMSHTHTVNSYSILPSLRYTVGNCFISLPATKIVTFYWKYSLANAHNKSVLPWRWLFYCITESSVFFYSNDV